MSVDLSEENTHFLLTINDQILAASIDKVLAIDGQAILISNI